MNEVVHNAIQKKEIQADLPEDIIVNYIHRFLTQLDEMAINNEVGNLSKKKAKDNIKKLIDIFLNGLSIKKEFS